jgi:single-strand DNA-binding protein
VQNLKNLGGNTMNQVIISGRLTKKPDLRMTESRKKVVSGSVAVQRNKETADFIDFVAWESNAERLETSADKGSRVIMAGELRTRTYEKGDKQIKATELFVNRVEIIDFKDKQQKEEQQIEPPTINYEITDSDLPF